MGDLVVYERQGAVGIVTLNRADKLNALTTEMQSDLNAAFVAAADDSDARVIVLTGAGRAFCVGADMDKLTRLVEKRGKTYDIPRPGNPVPALRALDAEPATLVSYTLPLAMKKPVIAAINGPCVGVGLVMACCCDVRFMGAGAFFGSAFPQRGLVAEYGLAWLLPRLIGLGRASDILLSGRRVEADEALAIGLVNKVVADAGLLAAAMAYAQEMAQTAAPSSTATIKRQLARAATQSYGEASGEAWDLLMQAIAGDDFQEGVASFLEKRPPDFAAPAG